MEDLIAKFYPKLPQIALRFFHMREYLLLPPLKLTVFLSGMCMDRINVLFVVFHHFFLIGFENKLIK